MASEKEASFYFLTDLVAAEADREPHPVRLRLHACVERAVVRGRALVVGGVGEGWAAAMRRAFAGAGAVAAAGGGGVGGRGRGGDFFVRSAILFLGREKGGGGSTEKRGGERYEKGGRGKGAIKIVR